MATCDCSCLYPTLGIDRVVSRIANLLEWFCRPRRPRNESEGPTSKLVRRINDELHEVYNGGNDDFEVIIIFFHGVVRCRDVDKSDDNIHVSTWTSKDEDTADSEVLWPRVWLVDEFPKSRIYTVKYDASLKRTARAGTSSLHGLAENLMQDIILAFPPEFWSRPVVLVGHSFGGIVIKEFLLYAHRRQTESNVRDAKQKLTIRSFLDHVKLIFYFSTPHHGMDITVAKWHVSLRQGFWRPNATIEEGAEKLNARLAILDGDFGAIAGVKGWVEAGAAEQNWTRWDSISFYGLVVSEASARHRIHQHFCSVQEDHFSISQPRSRSASSFQHLVKHIRDVLPAQLGSVETTKPTRLNPSQILRAGDSRRSSNGVYRLVMQSDSNLVLEGPGRDVRWSSKTALDLPNCYCVMQTDGNAVIYAVQDGGHQNVLWATGTYGPDDASHYMEVQNDGNVVIYDEFGSPSWATDTWDRTLLADSRLTSGQRLERGAYILSPNGLYRLVMQDDNNLVLYCTSDLRPVWASNTYKPDDQKFPICYFIMQADGNAVLYAGNTTQLTTALWSTKTASQTAGTHYIQVHDAGSAVMHDASHGHRLVWQTYSARLPPNSGATIASGQSLNGGDSRVSLNRKYMLLMQWDGNLVLYKKGKGRIWNSDTACQAYQEAAISYVTENCCFIMKPNGSAEIYAGSKLLWSKRANHGHYGDYYIEVQNDGNVVMYGRGSSREAQWATNTAEIS